MVGRTAGCWQWSCTWRARFAVEHGTWDVAVSTLPHTHPTGVPPQSLREAAADAAERRIRDNRWCPAEAADATKAAYGAAARGVSGEKTRQPPPSKRKLPSGGGSGAASGPGSGSGSGNAASASSARGAGSPAGARSATAGSGRGAAGAGESEPDVVDLTGFPPSPASGAGNSLQRATKRARKRSSDTPVRAPAVADGQRSSGAATASEDAWRCPMCTYAENPAMFLACAICGVSR